MARTFTFVARTFIQVTALLLTAEAAFFLARGNLGLSSLVIAELSAMKLGHNPDVVRSLSVQTADTWVGVVLLLVALLLQLGNALWPMRWDDFHVNRRGQILALIFCIGVFGISWWASQSYAHRIETQVQEIVSERPTGQ